MSSSETNKPLRDAASVHSDFGKYRLLAKIGRGDMGETYLAMPRGKADSRKLVVLKRMAPLSSDEVLQHRMFLDEGLIAARLHHPNIVQTCDAGEIERAPYMAMEFLDAQPLSRLRRAVPKLPPALAAHVAAEVLAGLHYAHELRGADGTPLQVVHRDPSPRNVFITYDGVVKVVNFGIAKAALASRTKTDVGVLQGKVSYMAPEQAAGDEVDRRADVFTVGVVLWELLTGKRLFGGGSAALTLKRVLNDEIPRVSSLEPSVDPALDEIVARALQRDLGARYATALEMRQRLAACMGNAQNWGRELGQLVSTTFAEQRRHAQQQIQACIAWQTDAVAQLPTIAMSGRQPKVASVEAPAPRKAPTIAPVAPQAVQLPVLADTAPAPISRGAWRRSVFIASALLLFASIALGASWSFAASPPVAPPSKESPAR